ncbi:hypothetical protein L9F63_002855, partial [Diploptera punctata]
MSISSYQSDGSPVGLQSLPRFLPPIGVFWDIENCQVPKGRSAIAVAQVIRDRFFHGYREAEFIVVCDVKKENSQVIQELNDAQVNLIHVASTCKNAADEKLRQSIRRFADIHGSPAAIILISGDINFAADLTDLKHRKKMHVILLHNSSASEALILCASEHHNFTTMMEDLPLRGTNKLSLQPVDMVVSNLPEDKDQSRIKNRLKQLSGNCGGRVIAITKYTATIRFSTMEFASRAQKRMEGEDVFGRKISVSYPTRVPHDRDKKDGSPVKMQSVFPHNRSEVATWLSNHDFKAFAAASSFRSLSPSSVASVRRKPEATDDGDKLRNCSIEEKGYELPSYWNNLDVAGADVSRSDSPTLYGWPCNPPAPEMLTREKTPEGYRRIKGTHKGRMASDENLNLEGVRKFRTPSPAEQEELERYFHPISASKPASSSCPVVLLVTNLDHNIEAKELRRMLLAVFKEHIMVLHVSVFVQSDGNYAAHVKVPSLQDAQYAISQLHRRKVGYKRILISYANTGGPSPQLIRSQIITLLLEVPGHRLPLFKFRELYESRYLASISMSDMYKMKDVCLITEEQTGRMVVLNPEHRNTPSPCLSGSFQDGQQMELPYCTQHFRKPAPDKGWAEQEMGALPNVRIGLKSFALKIHTLLQTHNGSLPLPSLPICYEAQFVKLPVDETGVPLEHLVSCLPGIEIYQGVGCVKYLRWLKSKANGDSHSDECLRCVSPSLATQLALFSRELVDLLKTAPHCQLMFNRFIPAYHHHFGRQCRVADYGFTKLIDLMDALPHIVQVMGEGNKRVITLSHRAQVRRFTSDLLRVLKSQASKQIILSEFPTVYNKVVGRPWDIVDYGVCELQDLLTEVSENTVVMTTIENDIMISIPKREQTAEEIEKTKQFAGEVVELLRHVPQCSIQFNKFIPAYHHHYGHQCKVADYGFTKLIELFEAIPHVAKVEDAGEGDRRVTLTLEERLHVLAEQVTTLVRSCRSSSMSLSDLSSAFLKNHGYALRPETYECNSLEQLIRQLDHSVTIVQSATGPGVALVNKARLQHLGLQARRVLIDHPDGKMSAGEFLRKFWQFYQQMLDLEQLERDLSSIVQVSKIAGDSMIELMPLQKFARNVYLLLLESDGHMPLSGFEFAYLHRFGVTCQPAKYGHVNIVSLLQSIPDTVLLRTRNQKKMLILNKELAVVGIPLPASMNRQAEDDENHAIKLQEDPLTDVTTVLVTDVMSIRRNTSSDQHNKIYMRRGVFLCDSPETPKIFPSPIKVPQICSCDNNWEPMTSIMFSMYENNGSGFIAENSGQPLIRSQQLLTVNQLTSDWKCAFWINQFLDTSILEQSLGF